jgi:DNA-binding transcriptional LysR family regulator
VPRGIADERNFSRAALRLGMTQPAVSQLLKRIEDLAGHRLVKRNRAAVSLTPTGEEVVRHARQALLAVDRALSEAGRSLRGESGRLRVGLSVPSLHGGIPALIRRFREELPSINVEMSIVSSQAQAAELLADRIDVTFGTVSYPHEALAHDFIGEEAMRVVLPRWHRLSGQARIPLSDLRDDAWVLPPQDLPLRQEMEGHFRAAGFAPRLVIDSLDFAATFGMVLANAGVALAAESFRDFAGPDLVLIPIDGAEPRLRHYLTYRAEEALPSVAAFLAIARQRAGSRPQPQPSGGSQAPISRSAFAAAAAAGPPGPNNWPET